MLDEFLAWWIARIGELVPSSLRPLQADALPALILTIEELGPPGAARVALREGGRERALGRVRLGPDARRSLASLAGGNGRPQHLLLRVADGVVLDREVGLPLAAERELASVLRFEMDRLTPFSADEVVHGHEVVRRDRAAGRLTALLTLARRDAVEPAVALLAGAGIAPDAIEGRGAGGVWRRIALKGGGRGRRATLLPGLAWGIAGLLFLFWAIGPFVRQQDALAASRREIARLAPSVAQASALRARITSATEGADVLARAGREIANPLATLAAVTKLLPDDTYLTDFTLSGRKLTLNGQSASAAKLIGALAADDSFRNPSFVAPVTRLEAAHTDLFSIRAEVDR